MSEEKSVEELMSQYSRTKSLYNEIGANYTKCKADLEKTKDLLLETMLVYLLKVQKILGLSKEELELLLRRKQVLCSNAQESSSLKTT